MRRRWLTQRVKRAGVSELDFEHRLLLQFRGPAITSDAGCCANRCSDAWPPTRSWMTVEAFRDPVVRWLVGDRAITASAPSASQIGRFQTKWLSRSESLAALADLPSEWMQ
jgi:hypothetical protein